MRALDIQDDPAVGSVDDNEVQHDFAVIVDEGDRDIGLVELLAQDLDRDRADPPLRTLDKKNRKANSWNGPMLPADSGRRTGSPWRHRAAARWRDRTSGRRNRRRHS